MPIYLLLSGVAIILSFSGCLIFFLSRHNQQTPMTFLMIMLAASLTVEIIGTFELIPRMTNVGGNVYTLAEITMIVLIYRAALTYRKVWIMYALLVALLGIQLYQMIIYPGIQGFPSITRTAMSIVVTILSLQYFFKLMRDLPDGKFTAIPMFWVNVGMLTYFGGNLFLFVVRDYLVNILKDDLLNYWILHNLLLVVSFAFYVVALSIGARMSKTV